MADVVHRAGDTHGLRWSVRCAAHGHVLQRQGHLLAILCSLVEVENNGHIVVSLDQFLVTRKCDSGASHIGFTELVGGGKGIFFA